MCRTEPFVLYLSYLPVGGIWVQCLLHISSTNCEDAFEGVAPSFRLPNHLDLEEFEKDYK